MARLRFRRRRRTTDLGAESRTLPNLLTMARIALIVPVLYFVDERSPTRSFVATLIYLLAALTDWLDGWLARRRNQVTVLGQFLDPLADKLMVTSVLVWLCALDRCPAWLVVALLARELAVTGLRSIAISEGLVIAASSAGKQKTALQFVGTMFLLLHFRYPIWGLENLTIGDEPLRIDFHAVGIYTLILALALSAISAGEYFWRFARTVSARPKIKSASMTSGPSAPAGAARLAEPTAPTEPTT